MTRLSFITVPAALLALFLTACGSSSSDTSTSPSTTEAAPATSASTPASSAPTAARTSTAPKSDIQAAVDKAVAALDQLGIQHTTPTRTAVGGSGAKAAFDVKIDGYNAGINIFPNADALKSWQKLSDQFGGVDVSFDSTALSLNSEKGVADSAKIAPKLADALGGEAHGV